MKRHFIHQRDAYLNIDFRPTIEQYDSRGCTFSKKGAASAVYGEDSGVGLSNHHFFNGFALAANV